MKKFPCLSFIFLALVSCCVSMALADEIQIINGDRLSGDIVRHDVDSVRIKTSYAGTLDIKWSDIEEITLDEPVTVLMKDLTSMQVESFTRVEDGLVLRPVGSATPVTVPSDCEGDRT